MASRPKHIIALEWHTGTLRAAEATGGEAVRILRTYQRPLDASLLEAPPAALGEAMGEWLRAAGFRAGAAAVAVPRQMALLRDLTVPQSRRRSELSEMVRLQAVNVLPVEEGKTELDFAAAGVDESGMLRVRIAAAGNEQLDRLRATLSAAGLRCVGLPLRPGLILSLVKAGRLTAEHLLLAEIGPDWSQVSLVRDGAVVLSRDLQRGYLSGKPAPDADGRLPSLFDENRGEFLRQTMAPLVTDMRATLNAFLAEAKGALPSRLLVTGELADHADLQETLAEALELEVVGLNPWQLVRAGRRVVDQAEGSAAFAGVLALAAGVLSGAPAIDFANPTLRLRPSRPMRPWHVGLAAAVCLLVGAIAFGTTQMGGIDDRMRSRRNALAKLNRELKDRRPVQRSLRLMAAWRQADPSPLESMSELVRLLPEAPQAYVEQISFHAEPRRDKTGVRMKVRLRVDAESTWNALFDRIRGSAALQMAGAPPASRENVPDPREHPYPIRYTFHLTVTGAARKEAS
jgi:Tfp pilus assembly PilM family ATPase